jgi:putative transposase
LPARLHRLRRLRPARHLLLKLAPLVRQRWDRGLRTGKAPGAPCRLTIEQLWELTGVVEEGPQVAGFQTGVWTGPMIRDWIESHFKVKYHVQHIPRMLHDLGFSVQRPRKRLARADAQAQAVWLNERLPAIKKKPHAAGA